MHSPQLRAPLPSSSFLPRIRRPRCLPLVIGLVAVLAAGCSSTTSVSRNDPGAYSRVTAAAIDKTARVHLRHGETVMVNQLYVTIDSTTGVGPNERKRTIPTKEIRKVEIADRDQGAIYGAGFGFATPIGIGLVGAAFSDTFVKGFWSILSGVLFSVPGALVGAAVGAIRGQRDTFTLSQSSPTADSARSGRPLRDTPPHP